MLHILMIESKVGMIDSITKSFSILILIAKNTFA